MEANKSFAPELPQGTGVPDLEQAASVSDRASGAVLEPEPALPGLEPEAPDLAASQGAPLSLRKTLQMGVALAMVGWFTFLFFSNDNVPVNDYRLSTMLPRPLDGWKGGLLHASNPSSISIEVGVKFEKFTSSSASRTYSHGQKKITVEIWDWAGAYPYHMPLDIPGWANGEPVRAGAEEGRLRYDPESKKGRLRVRYLDRFYLIVEGEGVERYELQSWYRRINLAGLRRELDELRGTASSR